MPADGDDANSTSMHTSKHITTKLSPSSGLRKKSVNAASRPPYQSAFIPGTRSDPWCPKKCPNSYCVHFRPLKVFGLNVGGETQKPASGFAGGLLHLWGSRATVVNLLDLLCGLLRRRWLRNRRQHTNLPLPILTNIKSSPNNG